MSDKVVSSICMELNTSIEKYEKYKYAGPLIKHDHYDIIEEIVDYRDDIHEYLMELKDLKVKTDTAVIRKNDLDWQAWLAANKQDGFELMDLNRNEIPRYKWWYWIDVLDELTDEQKSTI
ncbi:MAG: hypothetical protein H7Z18_11315 [Methylophilaceae bacterium]|nr:hypothetical protein [Methylophilaceae bacterium]